LQHQFGLKVHAMDVDTAFLNAPINEEFEASTERMKSND
jgi:hypothetical protein